MNSLSHIYLWNISYYFSNTSDINIHAIHVSEKKFFFLYCSVLTFLKTKTFRIFPAGCDINILPSQSYETTLTTQNPWLFYFPSIHGPSPKERWSIRDLIGMWLLFVENNCQNDLQSYCTYRPSWSYFIPLSPQIHNSISLINQVAC